MRTIKNTEKVNLVPPYSPYNSIFIAADSSNKYVFAWKVSPLSNVY